MFRVKILFFIAILSVYSFIVMAGIRDNSAVMVNHDCGQYYDQIQVYLELNKYVDVELNHASPNNMCGWIQDACSSLSSDPELLQDMVDKGVCEGVQG